MKPKKRHIDRECLHINLSTAIVEALHNLLKDRMRRSQGDDRDFYPFIY